MSQEPLDRIDIGALLALGLILGVLLWGLKRSVDLEHIAGSEAFLLASCLMSLAALLVLMCAFFRGSR
jgi:hypothetical protein